LAATAYIANSVGATSFFILKNFVFTPVESYFLYFLFFFGFGFKIPI